MPDRLQVAQQLYAQFSQWGAPWDKLSPASKRRWLGHADQLLDWWPTARA